ncbi:MULTISPECIES: VOC family protein [Acetobacter]|uniref:VOC family protein n=1 Tax=Acetobacter thailandicus TaxID=1502842 RepID=A0ABT3QGW3_9PROT|nr:MULTISPECIES: VOC family protein [Acetobacter]MBS0960798.1 VOC family protein [Acetobacter thailandicus]MBS0981292.1 VOC family protein [Acetobacter thailandicus]MBS0985874.1 VOC family protein [Acetobacter thailandicus]MBS1004451.1 VOC family protein [Acetobacter thailandicus]MCX2564522.1 VOC family protein [Acetobacter thailandicus]
MRFTVDRMDHAVLTVKDLEISASWYQRVLGMDREEYGRNNRTSLCFGGQKLNLRPYDATGWDTAVHALPGGNDLCFVTAVTSEDIADHLRQCGVAIVEGPVARLGALGPITSVYCHDPDENLIEIASYQS